MENTPETLLQITETTEAKEAKSTCHAINVAACLLGDIGKSGPLLIMGC